MSLLISEPNLTRRESLRRLGAAVVGVAVAPNLSEAAVEPRKKSAMGVVSYCVGLRRKLQAANGSTADLYEPLPLLQHCVEAGLGGIQTSLGVPGAEQVRAIREFAERHDLYVEGIVMPPKDDADLDRFTAEIRSCAEVGATNVRTVVMPGRRYEQFNSLAEVREAEARAEQMLRLALPVVTKHRVRFAVENHKDQRLDERMALYKRLGGEYLGACVDTGNSFALLDEPYEVIEALAPYAFTVHLKDQAVLEYDDGFLLGDIPLGQGCFDLRRMVDALRKANPKIRFNLELITRDPLKVTCLTEKYWATLPAVAGGDLARTLRLVRAHPAKNLQYVAKLGLPQQAELEGANVAASVDFARTQLAL